MILFIIAALKKGLAMIQLIGLLRVGSSILLVLVLLFVYANLPESVALLFDNRGSTTFFLSKNSFFYLSLVTFLSLNLIAVIFVNLFKRVPVKEDRLFFSSESFKENFIVWMGSFSPVINLFLIFVVAFVGVYNSGDPELIESYGYLAFLGQFLVLGWIISAIVILLKRNN